MNSINNFLFIALPYIAVVVFLVGTIRRYMTAGYGVSSLSAQFLEGKLGFWGTVPFHVGILALLLGHLVIFLFPKLILLWNTNPSRLIFHEGIAFTFGLVVLVSMFGLLLRRWTNPRLRMVTSKMDVFIELMIFAQVVFGCWIALGYRWGSSWFAADLSPYLWSILHFDPKISAISAMPVVIKLHVVGAFLIVLLIPFTRLMHFLVAPLHYIWRPYQVVMWYWDRKQIRSPHAPWQHHASRNS